MHLFKSLTMTVLLSVFLSPVAQLISIAPGHTEPSVEPDATTEEMPTVDPIKPAPQSILKFIRPEAKRRYPGERSPGARKPNCPAVKIPLTVLMPSLLSDTGLETWGQTLQEQPLLWAYVPYSQSQHKFELNLRIREDKSEKAAVVSNIKLPKQPGIVSIELPKDYKLEIGKNYEVFLSDTCAKNSPAAKFWLQRVKAPSLASEVVGRDRVKQLAENGIWMDTLTEVVKLNSGVTFNPEWRSFIETSLGWDLQENTMVGKKEKEKVENILKQPIQMSLNLMGDWNLINSPMI